MGELKFKVWDKERECFVNNFIIEPDGTLWSGGLTMRLRFEGCYLLIYSDNKLIYGKEPINEH